MPPAGRAQWCPRVHLIQTRPNDVNHAHASEIPPAALRQVNLTVVSVLVAAKDLPQDPLSALRVLSASEHELERIRRKQVIAARAAGASWQQIGDALGVTRQSAWESFTAETRAALSANVDANSSLAEDDALDLAVGEVRAVRRRGVAS